MLSVEKVICESFEISFSTDFKTRNHHRQQRNKQLEKDRSIFASPSNLASASNGTAVSRKNRITAVQSTGGAAAFQAGGGLARDHAEEHQSVSVQCGAHL